MRLRCLAPALLVLAAASQAAAGPVSLAVNHSLRLSVAGSASAVVVGNPQIADVQVVDSHTIFVSGRALGSTSVAVIDGLGRTIYSADVEVGAPTQGHVAVFRGSERSDFSCNPNCGSLAAAGTASAAGSSYARSAASSAAALPGMLGATAVAPIASPR